MSQKSRQLGSTKSIPLTGATLTLTGTPNTNSVAAPSGQVVAMLQTGKLSDWVSTGEVWRPLGVNVAATTTITVTNPVYGLRKAAAAIDQSSGFAAASSGGVATGSLLVAVSSAYYAFTTYLTSAGASRFTADAAGDSWRVAVSTSPSAGAATIQLHYVNINSAGISDAVTTL